MIVIDGRAAIDRELNQADAELRSFVAGELGALLRERYFAEALPGYFAGEDSGGRRMRMLVERMARMAVGE